MFFMDDEPDFDYEEVTEGYLERFGQNKHKVELELEDWN